MKKDYTLISPLDAFALFRLRVSFVELDKLKMDVTGLKKRIDQAIDDPAVRDEARRYSTRTRLAFLPDEVIGQSIYFRLLTLIYYYIFVYFHAFESEETNRERENTGGNGNVAFIHD